LKVVPIVIKGNFTDILIKNDIPVVVLNSWNDFDYDKLNLNYRDYNFNTDRLQKLLNINNYFTRV